MGGRGDVVCGADMGEGEVEGGNLGGKGREEGCLEGYGFVACIGYVSIVQIGFVPSKGSG